MPVYTQPILTTKEVRQYLKLRRSGAIGVLWADSGALYYTETPGATGFYRREQARCISAAEFVAHMRLAKMMIGIPNE